MLLVGDGLLTIADPQRHCILWEVGPKPCRDVMDQFAKHPTMSRWFGLGEALLGVILAEYQTPALLKFRRQMGMRN